MCAHVTQTHQPATERRGRGEDGALAQPGDGEYALSGPSLTQVALGPFSLSVPPSLGVGTLQSE